jgi:hypothetical protein
LHGGRVPRQTSDWHMPSNIDEVYCGHRASSPSLHSNNCWLSKVAWPRHGQARALG